MFHWAARSRYAQLFSLATLCAASLFAQATGSIRGTVVDSSNAAVPAASLLLTSVATGETRQIPSSPEGYFLFVDLSAATYRLKVNAPGFKELLLDNLLLNVGQQLTVRPRLEVGAVTETVEVSAAPPPVTTTSASVAQTVDTQRIERLPLNGRNALQLIALVPGVVQTGRIGQFGMTQLAFEVAGGRAIDMNFQLDGGFNMNTFYNLAVSYPNPDALQEFTVSTRTTSAVLGRGNSSVSASTRSGTNEFRGSLFEFLRNTELDARSFFALARPAFKRNQYGGTVGGPIKKNKAFFFFSYQGTKERGSPGERRYRSLTLAERAGDFSGFARPLADPDAPGQNLPGNRIPATRLRAFTSRFIRDFLPAPNQGDFFSFTTAQRLDQNQIVGKVDYSLSDKDKLSFRYLYDNFPQKGVSNGPLDASWVQDLPTRSQSWNLAHTRIWSPALVTDTRLTYVRNVFGVRTTNSPNFSLRNIGLGVNDGNAVKDFGLSPDSQLTVSGFFGAYPGVPTRDIIPTHHLASITSYISGKHKVDFGVEIYKNRVNELQNFFTGGNITFNGVFTGNAAADFLLGRFNDYRQISPVVQRIRQTLPSLFVQEDLRVNRNLTLNLGVRWDPFRPWVSEDDQFSHFNPGRKSQAYPNAPLGLLYPGDDGLPRTIVGPRYNNIAPRAGLAWDVRGNGKTSIRAGFGRYFVPITRGISFNRFTLILPFTLDLILTGGDADSIFGRPPFNGVNPFPIPDRTDKEGLRRTVFTPTAGHTSFALPFKTQTDHQWNLSLQQAIGSSSVLEINYIGASGSHLFTSDERNAAVYLAGNDAQGRPLSSVANTQQRRLFPQFGQVNDTKSALSSNYNGLLMSFNRRYSNGLSVLVSYSWSKSLGVLGSVGEGSNGQRDPSNRRLDYGPLGSDVRHNWVTSFVWELPWGAKASSALARHVVHGWQFNGIHTLRSGLPFTVRAGRDNSLTGVGGDTPDQVAEWQLPTGRSRNDKIQAWFNPAAFVQNRTGTVGQVGINSLRGPTLWNFDLGVSRLFRVTESKRVEFRGSFFNLFNNANLGLPQASQLSPIFGRVTGVATDPRVIEFGLKLAF